MNIPWRTIKLIVLKMKRIWHNHNSLAKFSWLGGVTQRSNQETKGKGAGEIHSLAAWSCSLETIAWIHHKAGRHRRVARRMPIFKKKKKKPFGVCQKACNKQAIQQMWVKILWSDEAEPFSFFEPIAKFDLRTPSPEWNVVVVASCYGDFSHQEGLGNQSGLRARQRAVLEEKQPSHTQVDACDRMLIFMYRSYCKEVACERFFLWEYVEENLFLSARYWGRSSPSNWTMILHMLPKLCWSDSMTWTWIWYNGQFS